MFRSFFNFFLTSKIHQKDYYQNQSKNNLSSSNGVSQINHNSSNFPSAKTASFQHNIANIKFAVNMAGSKVPMSAASQTTTIFEQTAEKTFNWEGVIVNISATVTRIESIVNNNEFYINNKKLTI